MNTSSTTKTPGNVVLTGFMGTGKTTVGRLLAQRLGYDFIDTDAIIEDRHGSISEIFGARGEAGFRAIEHALAEELGDLNRHVIATGGGMLLDDASAVALERSGHIFCLVSTPDEILARVTSDATRIDRPLLAVADPRRRIEELLTEREPRYRRFTQVTTTGRTPADIVDQLTSLLRLDDPTR